MIKSFNVDFNWLNGMYAPPSAFCGADAATLAEWYEKMGCDNFWTFAVSYNGYAWYDSKYSPKIEGLKGNFTKDCVEEGHKRGMSVFAYHCLAANPVIEKKYPEWSRHREDDCFNLIFCEEYIDLFCKMIAESIAECDYDGLVIDWFRCPHNRDAEWTPKEQQEFKLLMGYDWDINISKAEICEYEKRSIERAWKKIKATVVSVKDIPIWTNQPFEEPDDPIWNGNILMKEADYILNESPKLELLEWLKAESGEKTVIVQNLCGWTEHSMEDMKNFDFKDLGFFGFAAADPETCLPFTNIDFALKNIHKYPVPKHENIEKCISEQVNSNIKNIKIIKEMFK